MRLAERRAGFLDQQVDYLGSHGFQNVRGPYQNQLSFGG